MHSNVTAQVFQDLTALEVKFVFNINCTGNVLQMITVRHANPATDVEATRHILQPLVAIEAAIYADGPGQTLQVGTVLNKQAVLHQKVCGQLLKIVATTYNKTSRNGNIS